MQLIRLVYREMQEINFHDDVLPLKDKLFRVAFRIILHREEAEDIVQETLIRAWNKRQELSDVKSLEAFCVTIAKHLAMDAREKKDAQHVELTAEYDQATASTPYDQLVESERMELLRKFLIQLPEIQRDVFHLRDVEGKSYQEIAEALQLSEEQVKVYLFRARQKIRQQFIKTDGYGL